MTSQLSEMEKYYRWHAPVYDITRWTFLFGRRRLIHLVIQESHPQNILEIGCGTGTNLVRIWKTDPEVMLTGLDASAFMLDYCRRKLDRAGARATLLHRVYNETCSPDPKPDLILFSHSLSMINPGWELALDLASRDLRPGGVIAVVDFHDSPAGWFRNWMKYNHVIMEGHLLPALRERFTPLTEEIRPVFGGMWKYLLFIGKNEQDII